MSSELNKNTDDFDKVLSARQQVYKKVNSILIFRPSNRSSLLLFYIKRLLKWFVFIAFIQLIAIVVNFLLKEPLLNEIKLTSGFSFLLSLIAVFRESKIEEIRIDTSKELLILEYGRFLFTNEQCVFSLNEVHLKTNYRCSVLKISGANRLDFNVSKQHGYLSEDLNNIVSIIKELKNKKEA
ncbi:hypothetical protein [Flammeovirga pacifica]|uniref:Uncharacterized protein n=1 Tax=Flammeovirga pacifica TaxID=915059 RepID=A0A1S1Z591_FLAPC|nr:hypothetical protein [Flammeovirga pacifica]OHX68387.1 hypothetical protein NH26_19545 [Flammeovirga pacifica]